MNGAREAHVPRGGSWFPTGTGELLAGGAWERTAGGKLTSAKNLERAGVKQLSLAL